jgi:hypothetical protein
MKNDKIIIEFTNFGISGFFMLGTGDVSSTTPCVKYCKYNDSEDYKKIIEWIDKME